MNGRTLHDILIEGLIRRTHVFNTLLCYRKFTHSCRVSERREGKKERQVMPPLVLLIKFVLLLIIFQVNFSFNLLIANWRLSPEFCCQKFFPLAMATKMVAAWSAAEFKAEGTKPTNHKAWIWMLLLIYSSTSAFHSDNLVFTGSYSKQGSCKWNGCYDYDYNSDYDSVGS